MATLTNDDPPTVEKKKLQDFFLMGDTAKCLVPDCKSELLYTRPSHLLRHIVLKHASKLAALEELPIGQMNLGMLKESTMLLAVRHVTICGRPLVAINDESFRQLLDERLQRLKRSKDHKLIVNQKTIRAKIDVIVQKMKNQITKNVEGRLLSFAMDIASRFNRSIIGTSLQYVDGTKLVTHTIMMEKLTKRHNRKNLSDIFKKALETYNIPLQNVFALATDGGSNMIATANNLDDMASQEQDDWYDNQVPVFESMEQEDRYQMLMEIATELYNDPKFKPFDFQKVNSVRCGSHTFQLAVAAAFKESQCFELEISVNELIDSAREIVKVLRTSVWLIELDKKGVPIPVPDNKTRWFSKYIMLTSLKRCKTFIDENQACCAEISRPDPKDETPVMKFFLTEFEWKVIDEIINIMDPLYKKMKDMQADAFTMADFYGSWIFIRVCLIQYSKKANRLTDLPEILLKHMKIYEPKLFMNPLLLAAVYLNPRYSHTLVGKQKAAARNIIEAVHNRDVPNVNRNNNDVINADSNHEPSLDEAFAAFLNTMASESNLLPEQMNNDEDFLFRSDMLALETEMNEYEEIPMLNIFKTNVLEFWETKKFKFPMLYKISRGVMGVPSTQTIVERLFSSFAFILNSLRVSLSPELLQQILFIRGNRELFDEIVAREIAEAKS